jgi:NAD(P)-dependent dehydrogenase (short-subunit alcohol dehydrogenase family)
VAKDTYGKVDIAINTSGMYEPGNLSDLTRDHLRKYSEVSFVGPTIFIREAGNIMENGGSIITTTSVTVELSAVGLAGYVGTKAGADKIVQIAAKEYQHKSLKINSLSPGLVDTPMTGALFDMDGPIKAMTKESPLGRLANVQDVANTAVWMASDDCFTTGDLIRVSGGIQLNRLPTAEEMYE